jgi:hypothetical protein
VTPTGTRVLYALTSVLIGYGAVLVTYLWRLLRSELPGDRSPQPSADRSGGSTADACGPLEALTGSASDPSHHPGRLPVARGFSDPPEEA